MRTNPAKQPDDTMGLLIHTSLHYTLVLVDISAPGEDVEAFFGGDTVLGMLEVSWSRDIPDFLAISGVWARPGWGPVMYELGASFALLHGYESIHSDPHDVLPGARAVWEQFKTRPDVKVALLPTERVDYALALKQPRSDFNALITRLDKYLPVAAKKLRLAREEVSELLVEYADTKFSNAMALAFGDPIRPVTPAGRRRRRRRARAFKTV